MGSKPDEQVEVARYHESVEHQQHGERERRRRPLIAPDFE